MIISPGDSLLNYLRSLSGRINMSILAGEFELLSPRKQSAFSTPALKDPSFWMDVVVKCW